MSGETWTEYAVHGCPLPDVIWHERDKAETFQAVYGGTVVGRTVTATPWLPVDTEPKP